MSNRIGISEKTQDCRPINQSITTRFKLKDPQKDLSYIIESSTITGISSRDLAKELYNRSPNQVNAAIGGSGSGLFGVPHKEVAEIVEKRHKLALAEKRKIKVNLEKVNSEKVNPE
jgi:hypothetical protein